MSEWSGLAHVYIFLHVHDIDQQYWSAAKMYFIMLLQR